MNPVFFGYFAFSTKNARLVSYFEKPILENGFRSRHLFFLFYFKRENKIRNKNLKYDSYKKMQVWEKSSLGLGVRLLIRKVW